jgi:hypothetical protein
MNCDIQSDRPSSRFFLQKDSINYFGIPLIQKQTNNNRTLLSQTSSSRLEMKPNQRHKNKVDGNNNDYINSTNGNNDWYFF